MTRSASISSITLLWAALVLAGCHSSSGPPPPPSTPASTVGGTLSGLSGSVVLQLNGGNNLTVSASGAFTFTPSLASGTAYTVTVLTAPATQSCTVTNGAGTTAGSNVTNVTVACTNLPIISGVAAVGVPLAGTVTVKDSLGATKAVTIGTNGSYTVDVTGMTGPFVLRAEGSVNGHTYVVHSAATAADFGGTINVTQLTDLVVSNVAGQIAQSYFDAGNFGSLTPAALNAEVAALKQRLLPVLTALGVDASIDLLRSRFTPLSSALDTALDVLRVSYDVAANTATVLNIVTLQQIQDNLAVPAAGETNPPSLTQTAGLESADSDMDAVRAALTAFASKFATGLPSPASLEALMGTTFLDHDEDRATLAAELAAAPDLVGMQITDIDFKLLDHSSAPEVRAVVDATWKAQSGIELGRLSGFVVRKDSDGVWRLYGDQRVISLGAQVHPDLSLATSCMSTGLEFHIDDPNTGNNGGVIDHINVVGPGLPAAGVRFNRPQLGGDWDAVDNAETLASTCQGARLSDAQIAAIPDNSIYLVIPYSSTDDSVRISFPSGAIVAPGTPADGAYSVFIEKRAPTLAELAAGNPFPTITAPTATAFASYNGGPLTVSAGNLIQTSSADLILEYRTALGNDARVDAFLPLSGTGTISTVLELPAVPAGDVITSRSFRVGTTDTYRREFMSELANTPLTGTVSGLSGSVTLRVNGGNDVTVNANGRFSFGAPFKLGDQYTVAIASLPVTQNCGLTNATGTIGGANANVAVTCASYTLGGTITSIGGPIGSGLVLQVNGANDLTVPAAGTSFAYPSTTSFRIDGTPGVAFYSAHIKTQPAGQTCTILDAVGLFPPTAPNVTSVAVTCVSNVTDPLSGTYRAAANSGVPVPDRVFLTFYPDGTYILGIHGIPDSTCLPSETENLVQYGVYRYNHSSGELSIDRALHAPSNGCGGLDEDTPRGQFTVLGILSKQLDGSIELAAGGETLTLAPVTSSPGTLIGSWGNNQGFDVYGGDGTLFSATTVGLVGFPAVTPGIEDGCYLLSGTTSAGSFTLDFGITCAVSATQTGVDTTGPLGHSFFATSGAVRQFTVTGDSLQFTGAAPIARITN